MMAEPVASPAFIALRDVSKRFATRAGDEIEALREMTLDIPKGSFVSLLGPSGCGKSTLLRLIAGLIAPTNGQITIGGDLVQGASPHVGMVFQNPVLLPWRTVRQNTLIAVDLKKVDRKQGEERAALYLDLVGLKGFEGKYPFELSGGMQQRVAITRAFVHDPDVLLMDEPFAALDAMTRDHMQIELQRLWIRSEKTIVFVTHSIPEAVFLSDRVVVLAPRPGRMVEEIVIDLPRPRSLEVINSEAFGRYVTALRKHFQLT